MIKALTLILSLKHCSNSTKTQRPPQRRRNIANQSPEMMAFPKKSRKMLITPQSLQTMAKMNLGHKFLPIIYQAVLPTTAYHPLMSHQNWLRVTVVLLYQAPLL